MELGRVSSFEVSCRESRSGPGSTPGHTRVRRGRSGDGAEVPIAGCSPMDNEALTPRLNVVERGTAERRHRSEASPVRRSEFFEIGLDCSSDDEPACPRQNQQASHDAPSWDVERLFDFDVDTLVGLARAAAWGPAAAPPAKPAGQVTFDDRFVADKIVKIADTPSPRGGNHDDLESPAKTPYNGASDKSVAAELERVLRESAFKDSQIERLRRAVCELLLWGAAHWPQQQQAAGMQTNTAQATPLVQPRRVSNQLRAAAPEFVPLGIPWLAKNPAKDVVRRTRSEAPRHKRHHHTSGSLRPDNDSSQKRLVAPVHLPEEVGNESSAEEEQPWVTGSPTNEIHAVYDPMPEQWRQGTKEQCGQTNLPESFHHRPPPPAPQPPPPPPPHSPRLPANVGVDNEVMPPAHSATPSGVVPPQCLISEENSQTNSLANWHGGMQPGMGDAAMMGSNWGPPLDFSRAKAMEGGPSGSGSPPSGSLLWGSRPVGSPSTLMQSRPIGSPIGSPVGNTRPIGSPLGQQRLMESPASRAYLQQTHPVGQEPSTTPLVSPMLQTRLLSGGSPTVNYRASAAPPGTSPLGSPSTASRSLQPLGTESTVPSEDGAYQKNRGRARGHGHRGGNATKAPN